MSEPVLVQSRSTHGAIPTGALPIFGCSACGAVRNSPRTKDHAQGRAVQGPPAVPASTMNSGRSTQFRQKWSSSTRKKGPDPKLVLALTAFGTGASGILIGQVFFAQPSFAQGSYLQKQQVYMDSPVIVYWKAMRMMPCILLREHWQ
eukprot:3789351-Amphidinium_carterae.2